MAINRYELVTRHNPVLQEIDYKSPLTIGNGEFAFTADVTGLQTFYDEYKEHNSPLCTMSQWGWHTTPVSKDKYAYTMKDLDMTEYDYNGRKVTYAVEVKPGNEEVYYWLRQNPHRFNLARLGLIYDGKPIKPEELSNIRQSLNLYEGVLDSRFELHGVPCKVRTSCHYETGSIAVKIESKLIGQDLLSVQLGFPYGSSDITGSDWGLPEHHQTEVLQKAETELLLHRIMDHTVYSVKIKADQVLSFHGSDQHNYQIKTDQKDSMSFSITFCSEQEDIANSHPCSSISCTPTMEDVFQSSKEGWNNYWNNVGLVELYRSKDSRALELERRIILSLYQSRIQCCGSLPPQETGLTCNSWHGKFHLEMYLWHMAYLPMWNQAELLEPSLEWYLEHLPEARDNAARNGFRGAKWPKQVSYDGIDSPSPIATLLIWQQPHIIYLLELIYQSYQRDDIKAGIRSQRSSRTNQLLNRYWNLIKETADYMVDLAVYNKGTGKYDLISPVIPAQEAHDPRITLNPIFEVEYWRFTLYLAAEWAKRVKKSKDSFIWVKVAEQMADLPMKNGMYLAHQNCPTTFEEYNKDHPMMMAIYGLIHSDRVDEEALLNTLHKTLQCWDFNSMWGWDFAMMAMTATRLGYPDLAIDLLLMDKPNNQYAISGNNTQKKREDLPVYLPGNGSLLLAVAMMVAGYSDCEEAWPGFPKDGKWKIAYENIHPFPY